MILLKYGDLIQISDQSVDRYSFIRKTKVCFWFLVKYKVEKSKLYKARKNTVYSFDLFTERQKEKETREGEFSLLTFPCHSMRLIANRSVSLLLFHITNIIYIYSGAKP